MLVFQNLGRFLGITNSYDSSQVKAFYCVAERQEDKVNFTCPFKNNVINLTPIRWTSLFGLDCEGVDVKSDNTFTRYDKVAFVQSISKTCMLEQGCFTSHLLSFDNNKVLKIINWTC